MRLRRPSIEEPEEVRLHPVARKRRAVDAGECDDQERGDHGPEDHGAPRAREAPRSPGEQGCGPPEQTGPDHDLHPGQQRQGALEAADAFGEYDPPDQATEEQQAGAGREPEPRSR